MRKYWIITFVFFVIIMALAMASKGHAQGETGSTIFLPAIENTTPAVYRLSDKTTLYTEGVHFTKSNYTHMFVSSTYYGYFARAEWIQDIEHGGPKLYRVTTFTCDIDHELISIKPYQSDYIFIQRLSTSSKITIYR